MTYTPSLDDGELLQWRALRNTDVEWHGLLIGNGASVAVADSFDYDSLYTVACSNDIDEPLRAEAQALFGEFGTTNFEYVLASLKIAGQVCEAVGIDTEELPPLYEEIQRALFDAVALVHVDWNSVATRTLPRIRREVLRYNEVFSTNYDLLLYWAILSEGNPNDFRDFFWNPGNRFDATNTDVWFNPTIVYYLHGGLHLRRSVNGSSFKQTADGANLLTQFPTSWTSDETPLLISEGTSNDKLISINRSDYLSFAYRSFVDHGSNLVIFGHVLGEADDHIARAINSWGQVQVAISVFAGSERAARQRKQWIAQRLPDADIWFYDAQSHPLGQSNVRARTVSID
jgi:hypothetical protein